MGNSDHINRIHDFEQLEKYAKDFSEVCKAENQQRKELQKINLQLLKYAGDLKNTYSELKTSYDKLRSAYVDTIQRLVRAAEYRDEDTGDHILRIGLYSELIAEKIGLPEEWVQDIRYAAPMHDVGKIGIPDNILLKPGKLTEEEFHIIKTHTVIGAKILEGSETQFIIIAEQIALSHHEKWNGTGYPNGLKGPDIFLSGRIVAIADVFDALTSKRPYKDSLPVEVACDIIKKERGEHFEPDMVDIFLDNIDAIIKIKKDISEAGDIIC